MSPPLKVLHVEEDVSIFPERRSGCILVLGVGESPGRLCWIVPKVARERIWTVGEPYDLEATPETLVVDFANIKSFSYINAAETLQIVTNSSQTYWFQPVSGDLISKFLQHTKGEGLLTEFPDPTQSPEVSPLFETFAKVTNLYFGTARWLLGVDDQRRRPRRNVTEVADNPWLVSRELMLPPTRRTAAKHIPEDCPEEIFRMLLFCSGSREEERRAVWRRLFVKADTAPSVWELSASAADFLTGETLGRIDKDVYRTDRNVDFYYPNEGTDGDMALDLERPHLASLVHILRAYALYNPLVDYVQGLNDIASPLLWIFDGDEQEAFAALVTVMQRHSPYFLEGGGRMRDQLELLSAMLQVVDPQLHDRFGFTTDNTQLFVGYRWLLLLFKREVGFREFPSVLETIYTAPTANYELFIALAMLVEQREKLLHFGHRFDLTLQYYAQLTGQQPASQLLSKADQLYQYFNLTSSIKLDPRFKSLYQKTVH